MTHRIRSYSALAASSILALMLAGCNPFNGSRSTNQLPTMHYRELAKLPFEQACAYAEKFRQEHNTQGLTHALERIVMVSTDHATSERAIFELGHLYFDQGMYPQAQIVFHQFVVEFPNSEHQFDARYKEIQAFQLTLPWVQRDQRSTKELVDRCIQYLDDTPHDAPYRDDIKHILWKGIIQLVEKQLMHVDFYLNKYGYTKAISSLEAAEHRVAELEEIMSAYVRVYPAEELQKAYDCVKDYRTLRGFTSETSEKKSSEENAPDTSALPLTEEVKVVVHLMPDTTLTLEQRVTAVQNAVACIRYTLVESALAEQSLPGRIAKRLF